MKKIRIGDKVRSKYGDTVIKGIEIMPVNTSWPDDPSIELKEIWECYKNNCVFSLDNNHWSWGENITLLDN
jgi:hypothetical protein